MFAVVAQEFKKFYNAAKDDAQGRKPPAPAAAKGRDSKGLDSSTNDARQRLKEEKARKKAEEAEKIRAAPAAWLRCPRKEALARSRPRGRPSLGYHLGLWGMLSPCEGRGEAAAALWCLPTVANVAAFVNSSGERRDEGTDEGEGQGGR